MNLFVFIATAWGPKNGGINCFNYDLVKAGAHAKKDDENIKICCVAPDISDTDQSAMETDGVIPVTISTVAFGAPEAAQLIFGGIQKRFPSCYPRFCDTFYIGHDIYTGKLSKQLATQYAGWNVVFHHMDYRSYYLFKTPDPYHYDAKVQAQKSILCDADLVCAVGPLLVRSAQDKVRSRSNLTVLEVFPGLAQFPAISKRANSFNPIVFGRVEQDNQKVKQISLAIDAFAEAIRLDEVTTVIGNNPTLDVVGYEADQDALRKEVQRLQEDAVEIAGRLCNVVPSQYTEDRKSLGEKLSEASVAMMLSFHEGFGLVGYEAIAAGVPLILSKNSGLYEFLKNEKLDHLVYPVEISGSREPKGYSKADLDTVAHALREIRRNEPEYKGKTLELREALLNKTDRYSWEAVANRFIDNVLSKFREQLKTESTVFYCPEKLTKLVADLNEADYVRVKFAPQKDKHVYTVTGEKSLASIYMCAKNQFGATYTPYVYPMKNEVGDDSSPYLDFLSDCRAFFGKKEDPDGPEFKDVLTERLKNVILILDNFSDDFFPEFDELFYCLNKRGRDCYVFPVFKTNLSVEITPYDGSTPVRPEREAAVPEKAVPVGLTDEQKLMIKVLSFRKGTPYSKKLMKYMCNGINWYHEGRDEPGVFDDAIKVEEHLLKLGFVEEYSDFSYNNADICLKAADTLEVDGEDYALGISVLGQFYAECYYLNRNRDPQLYWGFFGCECFACAAALSDTIKANIKKQYEVLLFTIRKKAMDTSDYKRYCRALQRFIEIYERPDDLWLWYNLLHCESLCSPQMETLKKVENVLNTEFPAGEVACSKAIELKIQLIRLHAELEYELDIPDCLAHVIERVDALPSAEKAGIAWAQCLVTLVNLAIGQKEYQQAKQYLSQFKRVKYGDIRRDTYSKVIAAALETDLKLAQRSNGVRMNLRTALSNIKRAYETARDTLKDYRAQGWTLGLMGECQLLLKDSRGNQSLYKSMKHRQTSEEKTKEYKTWLQRITKYDLQQKTQELLNQEIARVNA